MEQTRQSYGEEGPPCRLNGPADEDPVHDVRQ